MVKILTGLHDTCHTYPVSKDRQILCWWTVGSDKPEIHCAGFMPCWSSPNMLMTIWRFLCGQKRSTSGTWKLCKRSVRGAPGLLQIASDGRFLCCLFLKLPMLGDLLGIFFGQLKTDIEVGAVFLGDVFIEIPVAVHGACFSLQMEHVGPCRQGKQNRTQWQNIQFSQRLFHSVLYN